MEKSRIKPKTKLNMQSMLLSLRCNWQRQLRSNKQLVLIAAEVKRVQISCWQHDCCLWQKEKSLEQAWLECSEEWWQELEEALKDVFIWARVPDMADTLLLLGKDLVFAEEIRLPQMEEEEMYQAIQWEAEQLVPWPKGEYNIAFAAHGTGLEEEIVQLWAWPQEQVNLAGALLWRLRLHLQGILVGLSGEKVQQAWYQGVRLKNWSLSSDRQQLEQDAARVANSRYPKMACLGCVLLAMLLHACAWGGCYLAQRQLAATQEEMVQQELWQQRYEESQRWDIAVRKYQHLAKRLQENSSHVGNSISKLGQQVGVGCWLEMLRGGSKVNKQALQQEQSAAGKNIVWQLEGVCLRQEDLERFLERLDASRQFKQVQLQHSQQAQDKLQFALLVREK